MTPHPQQEIFIRILLQEFRKKEFKPYTNNQKKAIWIDDANEIIVSHCASHFPRNPSAHAAPRICSLGVESSKCNTFPECSDCMTYHNAASTIRNQTLDEMKWMKPQCFGNHNADCDTKCAWIVRKRCIESLRTPSTQEHEAPQK